MLTLAWRRDHGPNIVAAVETIDASPYWTAATWLRSNPAVIVRYPRPIDNPMSAKIRADHLARETFAHVCTLEACGDWMLAP